MSAEYLTPEERAERVVRTEESSDRLGWRVAVGRYQPRWDTKGNAEADAAQLRTAVAAALRDHEQGLYALALADGPGEPPVDAEREETLRSAYTTPPMLSGDLEMLALLDHARAERDHARAVVAWISREEGVQQRIDAAFKAGWRACAAQYDGMPTSPDLTPPPAAGQAGPP